MLHLCMSQTFMEIIGMLQQRKRKQESLATKKLISQKDPNLGGTRVMDLCI